jgi:hypothetical protein
MKAIAGISQRNGNGVKIINAAKWRNGASARAASRISRRALKANQCQ